jgi:hypothetical protein
VAEPPPPPPPRPPPVENRDAFDDLFGPVSNAPLAFEYSAGWGRDAVAPEPVAAAPLKAEAPTEEPAMEPEEAWGAPLPTIANDEAIDVGAFAAVEAPREDAEPTPTPPVVEEEEDEDDFGAFAAVAPPPPPPPDEFGDMFGPPSTNAAMRAHANPIVVAPALTAPTTASSSTASTDDAFGFATSAPRGASSRGASLPRRSGSTTASQICSARRW